MTAAACYTRSRSTAARRKSGKTTFAGIHALTTLLLFGGSYPEATICANDQEQSVGRVFTMIRRIIESSPLLKREAKITQDRITFPAFDVTITAIPSNFATAAGGNQNISVFDELWAFTSGALAPSLGRTGAAADPPDRLSFDDHVCRLRRRERFCSRNCTSAAERSRRSATDLHAGDGILMFWSHSPVAPWQDERWLAEMRRTLRPNAYQRLVLNEFASAESQFVDMSAWDSCVQPSLTPTLERIPIYVGVDASTKRDSTALVAVTFDKKTQMVRLVQHRVFTPAPGDPINFEQTVEATIIDWRKRFVLRAIWYDPYQMQASAQRLAKAGMPIEEYPQTVPNLTAATQNLFDLIQSRSLVLYPDANMRLAASRSVIVESSRGWRLDKLKQQHKIDVVVALSMACLAAVRGQGKPGYDLSAPGLYDDNADERYRRELGAHIYACTGIWPR